MPPRQTTLPSAEAAPDAGGSQAPVLFEGCSTFAVHDLAALADGHLSQEGKRRLASHLPTCRICMATLVALVEDTQHGEASGNHDLARLLAATTGGRGIERSYDDDDDDDDDDA